MKSIFFLVILCTSFILVSAQENQEKIENFNDASGLEMTFGIHSKIDADVTAPQGMLDEMHVDLSFFPRESGLQKVNEMNKVSTPLASMSESDKYVTYIWSGIKEDMQLRYGIDAVVRTTNEVFPIKNKISFPLEDIDGSYLKYTQASPFIDITPKIEQQAMQLVGAEDDLYQVTFKLAEWTKANIKYDLSSLTADAVQKSSWVLDNKEGVCDELTNLFISMLRSLGIPAKFVSGMVYSNVGYHWGPHGWAEVYFPGHGWVPFDVTFGQYGWLDPSHIKLKDDADSGSPSAQYSWKSEGVDIDIGESSLSASLISVLGEKQPFIEVSLEPYRKAAAPGSFVPLLVTLKNTKEIYAPTVVAVRKAPGLDGTNVKEVLLHPYETRVIGWILQIPAKTEKNFIYTSALEVETAFGNKASSQIKYADEYSVFTEEEAKKVMAGFSEQTGKAGLPSVDFSCNPDKKKYYTGDVVNVACYINNKNENTYYFSVCIFDDCQDIRILSHEKKPVAFSFKAVEGGHVIAKMSDIDHVNYASFELNVVKVPTVSITDISPSVIPYKKGRVSLSFAVNTDDPITDVQMDLGFGQFEFDEIESMKKVEVSTSPLNLLNGLEVTLAYRDGMGNLQTSKHMIDVKVDNAPWYAKLAAWMMKLF